MSTETHTGTINNYLVDEDGRYIYDFATGAIQVLATEP